MTLRKYRGRTRIRIGNVYEQIDHTELRSLIRGFDTQGGSGVLDDGEEMPDSYFKRDDI